MSRLCVTVHDPLAVDCAFGSDRVGGLLHRLRQGLRTGQADDVIDAIVLAPAHRLCSSVMAVATEQDAGLRPTAPNAANEAAQMGPHFDAGGRLPWPQDDGDGAAPVGVIDVDRQEAALVVMRIEQRQLLMAVRDVACVVDIKRDGRKLLSVVLTSISGASKIGIILPGPAPGTRGS